MITKQRFLLYVFLFITTLTFAQTKQIDSLTKVLQTTNTTLEKVDIYNEMAFAYINVKFDSIKPISERAIALSKTIDYSKGIAVAKKNLAIYYFFVGQREKSFDNMYSSISIFKEEKDTLGLSRAYGNLAKIHKAIGQYNESLNAYDTAIYFNKLINDNAELISNYTNIAGIKVKQGNLREALKAYNTADELNKKVKDDYLSASIKSGVGLLYEQQGKFDSAIVLYDESIKIFKELQNTRNVAAMANNIGNIARKKGDYLKSIEYFDLAIESAKEINNPRLEAIFLNNLANNYLDLNYNSKALELYKESAQAIKGVDDYTYAATLSNIALIIKEQNQEEGLKYLQEAYDLYVKMDSKPNLITNLNQQADYYYDKKEYQVAKDLYLKSKFILKSVIADFQKSSTWIGLGKLNLVLKEIDSAQIYGDEALRLSKDIKALKNEKRATFLLYQIAKAKNDSKTALEYLEIHQKLNDSLFNEDKSKALGKLEAELDFKNQNEKLSLERETEKRESAMELRFRKNLILALAGVVLGLTIIVILLFAIKRQKAKTNRRLHAYSDELHSKNEKLKQLHVQKNRLISIISHDFRGPLNNLSDFLDLYLNKDLTTEEFDLWLPEIKQSIDSTQKLIENLVSWAKQSLNEFQINKEEINLFKSTSNLIELYDKAIKDKQIKIENNIPEDAQIYIDKNTLDLAIRNVMSNAIKYCNLEDSIAFSYEKHKDFHKVCIEDTGIGMNQETAEKLFNSDLISAIGTGKEVGTGIGALLSKNFIEENGGTIWVDYSEVGKGTRICFQVPVNSLN